LDQALGEMEDTLDGFPDKEGDLQEVLRYEAAVAAYQRNFQAYEAYNEGLAEKQARFDELGDVESKVSKLEQELPISEQFERDLVLYEKSAATYAERVQLIEETTFKAEDFLKAREAIQTLKVSVKSHLLPSLNKVASVLLSRMTGGERYLVEVDEDFEILIDGQPINTLSGSGKAVANLAIRIALGQILTNRVFSIFLADEVDAAMDDERAEHTSQALRRLTDSVGQVVLVTHKRPETDHMVELKRT
jgi:exonuclease SbcC